MRLDKASAKAITPHIIHSASDLWFETAFKTLTEYFGERGEMETLEVIQQRFNWNPALSENGYSLAYEMAVLTDSEDDVVAVGDYSIILRHDAIRSGAAAVVHLSHVLGNPKKPRPEILNEYVPLITASATQAALEKAGLPITAPITLAGEMESLLDENLQASQLTERRKRINRFLRAGLRLVDPACIRYYQPDFRSPAKIDSSAGPEKLLLNLMLRRLGREAEEQTQAAEIRHLVDCLYFMYAQGIRAQDMAPVYASLQEYPNEKAPVRLLTRI